VGIEVFGSQKEPRNYPKTAQFLLINAALVGISKVFASPTFFFSRKSQRAKADNRNQAMEIRRCLFAIPPCQMAKFFDKSI